LLFSKPKRSLGLDIGTHSVKAVQLSKAGGRLRIEGSGYAPINRNESNVDPLQAQADAVREALRTIPVVQSITVGALPGQAVVIRYPRLAEMPQDQINDAIEKEASQHIPFDLSEVFLDWSLLDSLTQGNEKLLKVLLVAAKHEVIDQRVQIAQAADVQFSILGVDSLALADAAEACDFLRVGETVALANIGLSSASIHFVKDGVSNFIRDVNWGARELIQAIMRGQHLDYDQAEKKLIQAGVTPPPPPPFAVDEAEAPPPPPPSAASSLLDPFEDELGDSGGRSQPAAPAAAAEKGLDDILAAPLARFVAEIRRSFDYYEHELYETAVNRLLLSGGVAHFAVLRDTLSDELGIKDVELADPLKSALQVHDARALAAIQERPAQFLVAVGLAARGTAAL